MDDQNYSRLLSFVVCEMTMPIKKHVYNFAFNETTSMKPQILSAAAQIAKSQTQTTLQDTSTLEFNTFRDREMSQLSVDIEDRIDSDEIQELCEGTEIEKSALGDLYSNFDCDKTEPKSTCATISAAENSKFIDDDKEEHILTNTQKMPNKRCLSKEDITLQPVTKKFKDEVSDAIQVDNNMIVSIHTALHSDPMLLCSDNDFKLKYKVTRSTFQIIVEILSEEELEPIEGVPLHKKVLIVLWLLGNSGSYQDAAKVFEISIEAVSSCFFDICATLYNKSETFIKWPSSEESEEISSRIEKNYGFPGVVGILGAKYFTISIPKESLSRREHFNGKLRMYCVALQLVCDDECIIRDIFPGLPGGTRPAQLLRDSPLGELLATQPAELIDPNKHILAPSEFPQLTSMLTPYINKSESLTKEEEEFNALHEGVCFLADQTFKLLKDRFRILKLLDPETATMVLVTTCVLHNICIQNGDTFGDEITLISK